MEAQALTRIRLAATVAVASVAATALILLASPATGGPSALTPDLVTLAIQEENLVIEPGDHGGALLRLTNEIGNRANGPLEVFPGTVSAGCDGDGDPDNDRDASQRVFADTNGSGAYETGIDQVDSERRFGCMRYHPAHDHWHVLDVARYELRREATGKLVLSSRKVGFCLTDTRQAFPAGVSPAVPTYPLGSGKPTGCDATSTQGISAGWADVYTFALPGQDLDVTGLPRGHYCLTSRADPLDLLDELV
ncbi:MAG: lysyl oxidase family protein [Solirubrobacterales bacterium]